MTALAVVGLASAVIVASRDSSSSSAIDDLKAEIDSLKDAVDDLEARNDSMEVANALRERGFLPCWPGDAPGEPDYYRAYNVTVRDGRFTAEPHHHWSTGTELRHTIPRSLVSVLEDFPRGEVTGEGMGSFGIRVDNAVRATDYGLECKLVVTVNPDADGNEIGILTRAGFYPVWRY